MKNGSVDGHRQKPTVCSDPSAVNVSINDYQQHMNDWRISITSSYDWGLKLNARLQITVTVFAHTVNINESTISVKM